MYGSTCSSQVLTVPGREPPVCRLRVRLRAAATHGRRQEAEDDGRLRCGGAGRARATVHQPRQPVDGGCAGVDARCVVSPAPVCALGRGLRATALPATRRSRDGGDPHGLDVSCCETGWVPKDLREVGPGLAGCVVAVCLT